MLYKLIPFFYLLLLVVTHFLLAQNYSITLPIFNYISLFSYFYAIFIAPITEELYIRYWLYGKNMYLRVGLLASFIMCILVTIIELTSNIISFDKLLYIYFTIVFLGFTIAWFLHSKKQNVEQIIQFINSFNQKWSTFLLITGYFIIFHANDLNEITWEFIGGYIFNTTVITLVARRYGIVTSILTHAMVNGYAMTLRINQLNDIGLVGIQYYFSSLAFTVILILANLFLLHKLHKNKDLDLWGLFKNYFIKVVKQ